MIHQDNCRSILTLSEASCTCQRPFPLPSEDPPFDGYAMGSPAPAPLVQDNPPINSVAVANDLERVHDEAVGLQSASQHAIDKIDRMNLANVSFIIGAIFAANQLAQALKHLEPEDWNMIVRTSGVGADLEKAADTLRVQADRLLYPDMATAASEK